MVSPTSQRQSRPHAKRSGHESNRPTGIAGPATGFVYYHRVSLNGQTSQEFKLLRFTPAS